MRCLDWCLLTLRYVLPTHAHNALRLLQTFPHMIGIVATTEHVNRLRSPYKYGKNITISGKHSSQCADDFSKGYAKFRLSIVATK